MTIPASVVEAINRLNRPRKSLSSQNREVKVGDLVTVESTPPSSERCIGLATHIDPDDRIVTIFLTSNEVECATDFDVVVSAKVSGLDFDLLIEGEVYGPIFSDQIVDVIGSLPESLHVGVSRAVTSDGDSLLDLQAGLPLGSYSDIRRMFKRAELRRLENFAGSALVWLSRTPSTYTTLHPSTFLPPKPGTPIEEAQEHALALLEVIHDFREHDRQVPHELLEAIDDQDLSSEMRRWRIEFGIDILSPLLKIQRNSRIHEDTGPTIDSTHSPLDRLMKTLARNGQFAVDFLTLDSTEMYGNSWIVEDEESKQCCRGRIVGRQEELV
jgi:hypothetical protein